METAGTLFLIWSMHAVVGAALAAPILYFGRKRAGWANWELLALVIPFCVWVVLMLSPLSTGRKSLANLGEPIYISFAMPVLALLRVAIGRRLSERAYAAGFITVLCVIAAAVFFMVPFKPE
jgi:peptidoglycan/LPS O-acetylase OafA/YrhL